jgi:N-acylglucosamine 2-epimerase
MSEKSTHCLSDLDQFYRDHLLQHVLPFYLNFAMDRDCGGYTTCLDNQGKMLSTDKYIWSQGRGIWTFCAAYNRMGGDEAFLSAAKLGIDFLQSHGRDDQGRWAFRVDRQGCILDGPVSIYSDLFVTLGLTEYYRATGDFSVLKRAYTNFRQAWARIQAPDFDAVAPGKMSKGWRVHGVPMILLDVVQELARNVEDPELDACITWCVDAILRVHYQPEYGLIFENVAANGDVLELPEGRVVNPGHMIECMWFLMHYARRQGRVDLIDQACHLLCTALEAGWDKEFGGIFLAIDVDTGKPSRVFPFADYKAWWPHTEALYALLLAHEIMGENWAMKWYWKVHDWCLAHLVCPTGDWYQRLDSQGRPIDTVIALPVKDPYHLPRALILGYQSLCREKGIKTVHDPFERLGRITAEQLETE